MVTNCLKPKAVKSKNLYEMESESYIWNSSLRKDTIKIAIDRWNSVFGDKPNVDYQTWMEVFNNDSLPDWLEEVPSSAWMICFNLFKHTQSDQIYKKCLIVGLSHIFKSTNDVKYGMVFKLIKGEDKEDTLSNLFEKIKMVRDFCWDFRIEKPQAKFSNSRLQSEAEKIIDKSIVIYEDKYKVDFHKFINVIMIDDFFNEEFIRPLEQVAGIFFEP